MKSNFVQGAGICLILMLSACNGRQATETKNAVSVPAWAKEAVWYQIFVERFANGDPANDPSIKTITTASDFVSPPTDWQITPWTKDWYAADDWAKALPGDFYSHLQLRRYGGDLQGVINKLDYLQDLGINAIYFNPLNDAPSLHKYDARNYHHIDVNFGPDPEGDLAIIAAENPADPETWQWTSADKLFLSLVEQCKSRNIRIILDYSWNHTGVEFWAWKDLVANQERSAYKDWYEIIRFDDPQSEKNEFSYKGWLNISSLPELKKVNATEGHKPGFPYEGNLPEEVKKHIFEVSKRWLAPDGKPENGIDGFRLDVADHVPMGFWRDYRQYIKSVKPDAYLAGEIWWQEWPDKLMNPVPYVDGEVFDAIMFYQVYRPARYFFAQTDFEITADQLVDSLHYQWNRLDKASLQAMMNTASTHDSPRLLTSFYNRGKYKFRAKPNDDPNYRTGKPDAETYARLRLYQLFQFTIPGAPHIWNGEEMGMWGADDPDCRKPLWWPEMNFEPETRSNIQAGEKITETVGFDQRTFNYYKQLIKIRKENPVLFQADIEFLVAEEKKLAYKRGNQDTEILVAFNLGNENFWLKLRENASYKDLLYGSIHSDSVQIQPLSAAILALQSK